MRITARFRGRLGGRVAGLMVATAIQVVFGIALIPIATTVLNAADFGLYALLISISAFASIAADGGASLVAPAHYGTSSLSERGRMFASLALYSAGIGTLFALLTLVGWSWRHALLAPEYLDAATQTAVTLTALMMPLRAISTVATNMFSAGGRGMAIGLQIATQSVVTFVVALLGLFIFDLHVTALFVGAFAGLAANLALSIAILRRSYGTLVPSRYWMARVKGAAPMSGAMGLLDGARNVFENSLLAASSGLATVGYWGHARLYQTLVQSMANSVGHNIWALSLSEARNPNSNFETINRAWTTVQLAQVIFGLTFALAGREIVDLISNGKLVPAAAYVAPLIVIGLIQNSGKAATATTFAHGLGIAATRFRMASMTVGTIAIWPAIHLFGVAGLIAIYGVEALAYRMRLVRLAHRVRTLPLQDSIAAMGIATIVFTIAGVELLKPSFDLRLAILFALVVIWVAAYWRSVADLIGSGRRLVLGASD